MRPDIYRLTSDIVSVFPDKKGKPRVYGKKGDKVKEVSDNDNVLIVEDSKGERFPVLKKECQKI